MRLLERPYGTARQFFVSGLPQLHRSAAGGSFLLLGEERQPDASPAAPGLWQGCGAVETYEGLRMPQDGYVFKKIGASHKHCTYCPKSPQEPCSLSCQGVYDILMKDREEDGIIVDDDPPPWKMRRMHG